MTQQRITCCAYLIAQADIVVGLVTESMKHGIPL